VNACVQVAAQQGGTCADEGQATTGGAGSSGQAAVTLGFTPAPVRVGQSQSISAQFSSPQTYEQLAITINKPDSSLSIDTLMSRFLETGTYASQVSWIPDVVGVYSYNLHTIGEGTTLKAQAQSSGGLGGLFGGNAAQTLALMNALAGPGLACQQQEPRVCYSICGKDYDTPVAAEPVCNQGGSVIGFAEASRSSQTLLLRMRTENFPTL
jgi:hypothetical protein